MKVILPVLALVFFPLVSPGIEPPEKPRGEHGQVQIAYAEFHKGCVVAALFLKNPDVAITIDTDDLSMANTSLNYIRGYFDAARQIQDMNPDLRVLDRAWKGCDVEEYVARVKEIMDGLATSDPEKELKFITPRDVLALAVRSRSGVPNKATPR